jgi:serine/threonine protein kinase
MFDRNFTPVIIDFGFSQKSINKNKNKILIQGKVTSGLPYRAPELGEGKEIDGEKADVFSLGAILFNFVTLKFGFLSAKRSDTYYKFIMGKEYQNYWNNININLSENFKDLYLRMVAYDPEERPKLAEILNFDWLKEVSNLTEDEEKIIIEELEEIHNEIKSPNEIIIEQKIQDENFTTRSGGNNKDIIFTDKNLKPKKISKDRLILNQAINISGNFSEVDYMNSLYLYIKNKFGKNSYFKALKNLSMEVDFEYEEEEEDKKEEDLKEDKDNQEIKEPIGDCQMVIELFEYEKGKYLLEFRRSGGSYADYYHHFLKIKEIITKKDY